MNVSDAVSRGRFVVAAYSMYDANPTNLTPPKTPDFPGGYEIAAWIQMSDFLNGKRRRVFYGFIAEARHGSAPCVLALRGTQGFTEWWDALHWDLVPFRAPRSGLVASGFADVYDTVVVTPRSTASGDAKTRVRPASFAAGVARAVRRQRALIVTAHSLGAALATLYVAENEALGLLKISRVYTFASPRVGNAAFARSYNALGVPTWRIVNEPDVVPDFPPEVLGYVHVKGQHRISSTGTALPTISCAHALNTYLHVLTPRGVPLDPACTL
jgi:Lipase (class 3)